MYNLHADFNILVWDNSCSTKNSLQKNGFQLSQVFSRICKYDSVLRGFNDWQLVEIKCDPTRNNDVDELEVVVLESNAELVTSE